jgi:pimeloyl-ACP methyl ester carboxylesterase
VRSIVVGDYVCGEIGIEGGVWSPEFVAGRWRGTPVLSRIREVALSGVARGSVERRYEDELAELGVPTLVVRGGAPGPGGVAYVDEEEQERYRRAGAEIVTFEDSGHDLFRDDATAFPSLVRAHVTTHA